MAPRSFKPDEFESASPLSPTGAPYGESGQSHGMSPEEFESAVPKRTWAEQGKAMAENALPSVGNVLYDTAHGLYQMARHPVDTYENFRDLGHGIAQKAGWASGDEHKKNVDAIVQHFGDKYGSMDNFWNTLATDPAGVLADASLAFTGAGGLLRGAGKLAQTTSAITPALQAQINAARGLGATVNVAPRTSRLATTLGEMGRGAQAFGNAIDPLSAVAKGSGKVVGAVAPHVIGAMTHTGHVPLEEAHKAGLRGGQAAKDFVENIKGTANTEDAVQDALKAIDSMHKDARAAYNAGMLPVKADKTVLKFDDINAAIRDANRVASFKGISTHPSTQAIRDEIKQRVRDWERLPPGQFHTAEGLDALKQHIGDLYDTVKPYSKEKAVLDKIYKSVWGTIQKQAPAYADVMKGYETARESIRQLQQEMSLPGKKKTNISTALNKLQSTMRNNVNTNYGRRSQLSQRLAAAGADINPKLAGQNLQAIVPRGLGRLGMQLAVHGGVGAAAASTLGIAPAAAIAATLPMMSPRLMGNAFYHTGKAQRALRGVPARPVAQGAYQIENKEANPYAP